MHDGQYDADEIGAYGATEQPAVAARMTPHRRMTQVGTGCAALAVVAASVALARFPNFSDTDVTGRGWAVTALVGTIVMLVVCVVQVVAWGRAMASWQGRRVQDLHAERRLSWIAHLVSYLAVLVTLLAGLSAIVYATWAAASSALLTLTLLLVLSAQVLAGVQYLRASGPPGTVPAHMRRLVVRYRDFDRRRRGLA